MVLWHLNNRLIYADSAAIFEQHNREGPWATATCTAPFKDTTGREHSVSWGQSGLQQKNTKSM